MFKRPPFLGFFLILTLLVCLNTATTAAFDELEMQYLNEITATTKKYEHIYPIDPLFVLAVIKAESGFYRWAISSRGAAGPAQLMPQVAKDLGMRVYLPPWYEKALKRIRLAEAHSKEARKRLAKISYKKSLEENKRLAMEAVQDLILADRYRQEANEIFKRYKTTLLKKVRGKDDRELTGIDERFIVSKAINACIMLLTESAKSLGRDWRVLASAYNAGLTRVMEAGGIPFLEETVVFQNRVMNFYKEYLKKKKLEGRDGDLYDATR